MSTRGNEKLSRVIACTLRADALREQAGRWRRLQDAAGLERIETRDGLRLGFRDEPAVEAELRGLVAVERECCAWARWEIRREGDVLALDITSAGAGIAALHAMFSC
jgi:hypothetical protein